MGLKQKGRGSPVKESRSLRSEHEIAQHIKMLYEDADEDEQLDYNEQNGCLEQIEGMVSNKIKDIGSE